MACARTTALCFLAAALVASCSRSPLKGPADAKLTYYEASALAVEAAKANGVSLEKFAPPVVSFDHSAAKPTWRATFTMTPPTPPTPPGAHFFVLIDDITKKTAYYPGE